MKHNVIHTSRSNLLVLRQMNKTPEFHPFETGRVFASSIPVLRVVSPVAVAPVDGDVALPAALGAWAATQSLDAHKGRPVLAVSGDGGLGQYLAEFTTAVKYGMNITHVLLNNNELGKISKEQRAGNWPVWQTALQNPDFVEFAIGCGGLGVRVSKPQQLEPALAEAISYPGPALVEILTDPELV